MKQALSIFLALTMLTSNMGVTFATHYCGGIAVKSSIYLGKDDLNCGMERIVPLCENSCKSPTLKQKKCCENKYTQLSIEDEFNTSEAVKIGVNIPVLVAFIVSYFSLYSFDEAAKAEYSHYFPPLLVLDIPVLIQSFLI